MENGNGVEDVKRIWHHAGITIPLSVILTGLGVFGLGRYSINDPQLTEMKTVLSKTSETSSANNQAIALLTQETRALVAGMQELRGLTKDMQERMIRADEREKVLKELHK